MRRYLQVAWGDSPLFFDRRVQIHSSPLDVNLHPLSGVIAPPTQPTQHNERRGLVTHFRGRRRRRRKVLISRLRRYNLAPTNLNSARRRLKERQDKNKNWKCAYKLQFCQNSSTGRHRWNSYIPSNEKKSHEANSRKTPNLKKKPTIAKANSHFISLKRE